MALSSFESGDLHEIELTLYEEHTEILYDEIPVIVPDQDATSQALCWDSDIDDSFDKYSSPGVAGDYFFTVIVRDPEGHESNEVYKTRKKKIPQPEGQGITS
jgi:hypothetical protein